MESKEPDSTVDIVKEVASALEEEEFTKNEPKNTTKVTPTTKSNSLPKKHPSITAQLPIISPVNITQNAPASSSKTSASPPQERIRSEAANAQKSAGTNPSTDGTKSATWQGSSSTKTSSDDDGGSMWGWMSSAMTAGLQTTQNIGRNIVEKTKVSEMFV